MDFIEQLAGAARRNETLLCVGLDPEPAKFPGDWANDASRIFDFCAAIVDATKDLVLAFKPQIAHFAAHRAEPQLERLIAHIHAVAPGVPVILDAKRGDIGSTAEQYAKGGVRPLPRGCGDAVAVHGPRLDRAVPGLPRQGRDPAVPHLERRRQRPAGAAPRRRDDGSGAPGELLYERIARLAQGPWNSNGQLGLVVGATFPAEIERVRALAPTLPLLIPGIGAQGGDAEATVRAGARDGAPIIVSSSRAILYAGRTQADFADAARQAALATRAVLDAAKPAPIRR